MKDIYVRKQPTFLTKISDQEIKAVFLIDIWMNAW